MWFIFLVRPQMFVRKNFLSAKSVRKKKFFFFKFILDFNSAAWTQISFLFKISANWSYFWCIWRFVAEMFAKWNFTWRWHYRGFVFVQSNLTMYKIAFILDTFD